MRTFNILVLAAFFIGINSHISFAVITYYTSSATGAWSSSSSWTGSAPPVTAIDQDDITVNNSYTITRTGDLSFNTLNTITVTSGSTLRITGDITVNATLDAGLIFDIEGSLIIDGEFNVTGKGHVIFKGSGNIRINNDVNFSNNRSILELQSGVTVIIDGNMVGDVEAEIDGTGTFNLSGTKTGFKLNGDASITFNENQPLPVDLYFFKAKIKNEYIELIWETLTETNNDYFTIERSADGLNFRGIGTVKGSGTTKDAQQYTFRDTGAPAGQVYYRLKQTDFDGTTETFKIVAVNNLPKTDTAVLYPNPLKSGDLKIRFGNNQPNATTIIEVMDKSGRQVLQKTIEANTFAAVQLDADEVEQLQRGMYIIRLQNGGDIYTSRFMKL